MNYACNFVVKVTAARCGEQRSLTRIDWKVYQLIAYPIATRLVGYISFKIQRTLLELLLNIFVNGMPGSVYVYPTLIGNHDFDNSLYF